MDCIFCKIVKGEIPSSKVYEDDMFIAFMDIAPIAMGHTLIVPKAHCRNIFDMPDEVAAKYYTVTQKVAKAVRSAYNADGANIMQFNEPCAGQEVFHSHIHIIPRYNDDGMKVSVPPRLNVAMSDIIKSAELIRLNI